MPLAPAVRITFKDAKNKSSFTKIRIPTSLSVAQWTGFAAAAAQVVLNLSTCRITKVGVYASLDLTGFVKASPALLSDVEQKAQFRFFTNDTGFDAKMFIPAINENIVLANSDVIDEADATVAAFITAMETGFGATTPVTACDSRANDVTALKFAREVFNRR